MRHRFGILAAASAALIAAAGLGLNGPGLVPAAAAATPASSSAASSSAAQAPATGRFFPVATARVFAGSVGTGAVTVPVAGRAGVPSGATAVVVNVEVEAPTAAGYVRVTPAGGIGAQVAVQEFVAGQTISNLTTVQLQGGDLQVKVSAGAATVLMDVSGYYADDGSGSTYTPVAGSRILDAAVGTQPTTLRVAGVGGVGADATAVVVNTEIESPSTSGYVRVTPDGGIGQQVAVQEFARGQTISNLVTTKLDPTTGALQLKVSAGTARVFMDVVGFYSPSSSGSVFTPIATTRASSGPVGTTARQVILAGVAGVPATATAVVANAEVTGTKAAGYLRITPGGTDAQVATQEFRAGQTVSNLTVTKLGGRSVQARTSAGTATLFLDVSGYFLDGSSGTGVGADVSWPQCGASYPAGQAFGVVGVNGRLGNTTNPCLSTQLAWAAGSAGGAGQDRTALYVLFADPGKAAAQVWPTDNQYPAGTTVKNPYGTCANADTAACSYMYGYARAYDDATSRGVASPAGYLWWLDVETGLSHQADTSLNVAAMEGMVAAFRSQGVTRLGIYSSRGDWATIAGTVRSTSSLSTLPNWLPIGPATLAQAQAACATAPLARGRVTMTQYVVGSGAGAQDFDTSCP